MQFIMKISRYSYVINLQEDWNSRFWCPSFKKLEKQCYNLFGGWIRCCCHAKRADSTWSTTCMICTEFSCMFSFKTAFFFKRNAQWLTYIQTFYTEVKTWNNISDIRFLVLNNKQQVNQIWSMMPKKCKTYFPI